MGVRVTTATGTTVLPVEDQCGEEGNGGESGHSHRHHSLLPVENQCGEEGNGGESGHDSSPTYYQRWARSSSFYLYLYLRHDLSATSFTLKKG
jgi:hypothetical protein